jgi:hypothetical protein
MATKKQKPKKGSTQKKAASKKTTTKETASSGAKATAKTIKAAMAAAAVLPESLACRGCVEQAVRTVCGPFSSISQSLDDICAPCNTGKLHQLEQAVAHCAGGTAPTLECSMTVRDVIDAVCG